MGTTKRLAVVSSCLGVCLMTSETWAWNPPSGPQIDLADTPAPGTLATKGHGYITQTGISILYNDGYWFAAQWLTPYQQELLNGVRYADVYLDQQRVVLEECVPFIGSPCHDLATLDNWPFAADKHYFNPDTGIGLDPSGIGDLATWAGIIQGLGIQLVPGLKVSVHPAFEPPYTSALEMMSAEYTNARNAYFGNPAPSVGNRQGRALAMFHFGWASHLMQDQTVVHHTFDEFPKNHRGYENQADGLVTAPPTIWDRTMSGIYFNVVSANPCAGYDGTAVCFAAYAAFTSHDASVLSQAENGNYTGVLTAIPFAQRLQAGLYAKFLTDIGLKPVHMSAVVSAMSVVQM